MTANKRLDGAWPVMSIVTTSFNQARFLRDTIESVLSQGYPQLQYVIVDGGSTDGSVEIIREYSERLHWWVSEPDDGPETALNKGFEHTSGELMAFIGSSDKYLPGALLKVGEIFRQHLKIEWVTTLRPYHWDETGRVADRYRMPGYSREGFFRGEYLSMGNLWNPRGWIQAESTFWRRSLWLRTGARINPDIYASDFDLWARFYQQAELYGVDAPLAGYRLHHNQRAMGAQSNYLQSGIGVLHRLGFHPNSNFASRARIKWLKHVPAGLRSLFANIGILPWGRQLVHAGPDAGWLVQETPIVGKFQKLADAK